MPATKPAAPLPARARTKPLTVHLTMDDYYALRTWCTEQSRATGAVVTHRSAVTEALHMLLGKARR